MQASSIRHLAITDESSIVAAALFEKAIQIWSWKSGQQLGEFDTMLDFGGRRLALTPDGAVCIVGAWGQRGRGPRGLAAYSVPDGKLLWNREEIRHIQYVRLSGSGHEIYCGVEGSSAQIVDTGTGQTLRKVRGARRIWGSQYTAHQLIMRDGPRYLVRGKSEFEIHPLSFALLDACFSPDALCVSEPKNFLRPSEQVGGIRLLDLRSGEVRWHLDRGANELAYNSSDSCFYCVAALDTGTGQSHRLIRFGGTNRLCEDVALLDQGWESAFSPSGKLLATAKGDVYETSTAALLMHLDFPQKLYPGH
jgi:hypothetical protein